MMQRYTGSDPTFKAMQAAIDAGAYVVHLDAHTIGEYTSCGRITTCERTADINAVTCAVCLAEHEAYTEPEDDTTAWGGC